MTKQGRAAAPRTGGVERSGGVTRRASENLLRQFAALDIVMIAPDDPDIAELGRNLVRLQAKVRHDWPLPEPFPREADIVICDAAPGLAVRLPWLPGAAPLTLVLLVPAARPVEVAEVLNCAPHGILTRPVAVHGALATLLLARSQALYEQRLRARIDRLDENLRTTRDVERAKLILMQRKAISEDEAYRFMRQHAMERRVSIGAIANIVIDSHDLLG